MNIERLIATESVTLMDGREAIPVDALRAALDEVYDRADRDHRTNGLSRVSDVTLEWLHAMRRAALASSRPEPLKHRDGWGYECPCWRKMPLSEPLATSRPEPCPCVMDASDPSGVCRYCHHREHGASGCRAALASSRPEPLDVGWLAAAIYLYFQDGYPTAITDYQSALVMAARMWADSGIETWRQDNASE